MAFGGIGFGGAGFGGGETISPSQAAPSSSSAAVWPQVVRYGAPGLYWGLPGAQYAGQYTAPTLYETFDYRPGEIELRLYDRATLQLIDVVSNRVQKPRLGKSLDFEMQQTGCAAANFSLARNATGSVYAHGTLVEIYLWGDPVPRYTGFIQQVPWVGTSDLLQTYQAMGLIAKLDTTFIQSESFSGWPVWSVVKYLVQKYLVTQTPIVWSAPMVQIDPINVGSSYLVGSPSPLNFAYCSMKLAIDTLANLAGGYEWGVDEQRRFFFRFPPQTIADWDYVWISHQIQECTGPVDTTPVRNKLHVKIGSTTAGSVGAAFLSLPVEDLKSQRTYGVMEGAVSAPNAISAVDGYFYGASQLAALSTPPSHFTAQGIQFEGERRDCTGLIQITDRDGNMVQMPKASVKYEIADGVKVTVQPGDIIPSQEQVITEGLAQVQRSQAAQNNVISEV